MTMYQNQYIDNYQNARMNAHPNSPLGDPNGWLYGGGQYTYKMPVAQRDFEWGDYVEEMIRFYAKWAVLSILVGLFFMLFGTASVISAMFTVMAVSVPFVAPFMFFHVRHRFMIYELN